MLRTLIIIIMLLVAAVSNAANYPYLSGGLTNGMAGAGLLSYDNSAVFNNPSALSQAEGSVLFTSYLNNYFLKEVGISQVGFSYTKKNESYFIRVQHLGLASYNEYCYGFGYSRTFNNKVSFGLTLLGCAVKSNQTALNKTLPTFDLSLTLKLSKNIHLSFYTFNPILQKYNLSYYKDQLPSVLRMNAMFVVHKQINVEVGSEINNLGDPIFRYGIRYLIYKDLDFGIGYATNPNLFSAGAKYKLDAVNIALAYTGYELFGRAATCSISYDF